MAKSSKTSSPDQKVKLPSVKGAKADVIYPAADFWKHGSLLAIRVRTESADGVMSRIANSAN